MTKRDWLTLGQVCIFLIQIGVVLHTLLTPVRVQVSCPSPKPCCCEDADGGTD